MAHDMFDFQDGWEQKLLEEDEVIDLEEELMKRRQELLAEQWRDGELYVTTELVTVYENPVDPSPVVCEFGPDTVILLATLQQSENYGGFRDVLLPIRGWIWTSIDEYDLAFAQAKANQNRPAREASGSMMSFQKLGKKAAQKFRNKRTRSKSKHEGNSNTNNTPQTRDHAFSDADAHKRNKTNHLYVDGKQREQKHDVESQSGMHVDRSVQPSMSAEPPPMRQMQWHASSERDFSMDSGVELSSRFRKHSHAVGYAPAAIARIEKPIALEELDREEDIMRHVAVDSDGLMVSPMHMKRGQSADSEYDGHERATTPDHIIITAPAQYSDEAIPTDQAPPTDGGINGAAAATEKDGKTELTAVEKESLGAKIVNSKFVRKTIHFVRSHPALLTLIYIVFTGFVEGIIFFDIITDIVVTAALSKTHLQFVFVFSAVLIITPYFIAWSSLWGLIEKKREQVMKAEKSRHIIFKNLRRYRIFTTLFSFAPFGVLLLILFDLWIVFEFILIRPFYFLCLCKFKLFRTDTFEELGYRKLRRVSEVCSESIFQAFIQLYLLLKLQQEGGNSIDVSITSFDVSLSLLASAFVIVLWFGIILRIESSANGISLIEYIPIVLQGSFKFVPFLPAIERGSKNGLKVNWCMFKFDLNALSALGKALGSPGCNLQLVKVSSKSFKKLPRAGCKFFARLMSTAMGKRIERIQVIVSRLDRDLEDLFDLFDPEGTKYFNFINFCRATLALRAQDNETLQYREISKIFYELAAKKPTVEGMEAVAEAAQMTEEDRIRQRRRKEQKVWLLDLIVKLRTGREPISILDIKSPEDYCVKKNNVNMLTFCRAMGFPCDNHEENVIAAVCQNKLDIAHALTEHDGVPIVVEITEGLQLLTTYMEFHKPNAVAFEQQDDDGERNMKYHNNLTAVDQYHRLNKQRRAERPQAEMSARALQDEMNALFHEVSVYVSVTMCEQEKATSTTKETINQFWNERLLFIVPYSVIDEIVNDPTSSISRDTEHNERFMGGNLTMHTNHSMHILTGLNTMRALEEQKQQMQTQHEKTGTVRVIPEDVEEAEDDELDDAEMDAMRDAHGPSHAPNATTLINADGNADGDGDGNDVEPGQPAPMSKKELAAMRLVPSTESQLDDEEEDGDNADDAETETQVHAPAKTVNFVDVDADEDGNDGDVDGDGDNKKPAQHKSSLTAHLDKILCQRPASPAESIPDQSPGVDATRDDDDSFEANADFDPTTENTAANRAGAGSGQVTPVVLTTRLSDRGSDGTLRRNGSVFGVSTAAARPAHHRGRESALRDSLHITKFLHRKSSFAPGLGVPDFERKIYLDFNLFDESGMHQSGNSSLGLPDQRSIFPDSERSDGDFPATQSVPAMSAQTQKNRFHKPTHYKKMMHTPRNFASYDSGSEDEEENKYDDDNDDGMEDANTPRARGDTPRARGAHSGHLSLNDNAGIDGGEGTFLGSCHISINIDDSEELAKYHTETREKIVKIGKGGRDEGQKSKLKFKVYCNALSAYLKHGKNYGDRVAEEMYTLEVLSDKNGK